MGVMTREFEEAKNAPFDRTADETDREALRFVKSWHRHPVLYDAIWYRGINLGEVNEFMLLPEVITALVEREERERL